MRSLDLFSCLGFHAVGFDRAGIQTVQMCEANENRRFMLQHRFPEIPVSDDVRTISPLRSDIVIGGPPCQRTSVAAAIHGYRSGESLWPYMLHVGLVCGAEWFVVEQPTGNEAWETEVSCSLSSAGRHVARFEFGAHDVGAPYIRRRVYLVACTSLSRLEIARSALPSAIAAVKRAADARGDWSPDQLGTLRVDAWCAGEMERSESSIRKERIEALGDSNPPHMAEVIGRAIMEAQP